MNIARTNCLHVWIRVGSGQGDTLGSSWAGEIEQVLLVDRGAGENGNRRDQVRREGWRRRILEEITGEGDILG